MLGWLERPLVTSLLADVQECLEKFCLQVFKRDVIDAITAIFKAGSLHVNFERQIKHFKIPKNAKKNQEGISTRFLTQIFQTIK